MFEVLEHTADIGLRAWGKTKEELFENAAIGMVSLAVEIEDVEPRIAYPVAASGTDQDSLLVNWLGEVLYYLDAQHVVLRRFHVEQITAQNIVGQAWGEPRDPARHRSKLIIKGVTYHQLRIAEQPEGWCAEVFLDI